MEKRAFPVIGDMRVDRIGREDILRILEPVWTTHPEEGAEAPPAHPGDVAVVPGARARGSERRR